MNRRLQWLRISLVLVGMCSASSAQAQLFFDAQAVFLDRNSDSSAPFISGTNSLSTGGGYGWEPGYRLGLGWIGESMQIDAGFTQISPWESSRLAGYGSGLGLNSGAGATNSLSFPGFVTEAANSTFGGNPNNAFLAPGAVAAVSTESNYKDWELNIGTSQYKRPWRVAVGYRGVTLDEKNLSTLFGEYQTSGAGNEALSDFNLTSAGAEWIGGTGTGFDMTTPPTFLTYSVFSKAQNELNGAQALFAYRFYDGSWFMLEGTGKAGVYYNSIHGQVQETLAGSGNNDSVYRRTLKGKDEGAAFVGNLGLRAIVGITDYIDLVLGYEVLFLSGVALGPDQLNGISQDSTNTTIYRVQHDRSLIANGGNIGLRIYW